MTLRAGFAEIDITPPIGTAKIGWLMMLTIEEILDPLYARAAVFESDAGKVGFIALDLLSIRWTTVQQIRAGIRERLGFPGEAVMVGATHNHGGPAVAHVGDVKRDERYTADLVDKCVRCFGEALQKRQPAEVGLGSAFEFGVAFNRRVLLRDNTTRTHGNFKTPDALCIEGPMDPEVAVIAARTPAGKPLGAMINFACHPTHHGGGKAASAGWPGELANSMKKEGWPIALFLQGAAGQMHTSSPAAGTDVPMDQAGSRVAQTALQAIGAMTFRRELAPLAARSRTVQLPYRNAGPEEIKGTLRGAQRFVDPKIYDRHMPALLERIRTRRIQPAEVQAIFMGEHALVSIPAEYFIEPALRIKRQATPRHALVVAYANGMVGYVPARESFEHGGYETTFAGSSRQAPEAADILADAAVELIRAGA